MRHARVTSSAPRLDTRVTRARSDGAGPASLAGKRPRVGVKTDKRSGKHMRRVKVPLGLIVALMLLFYAGGNVAFADSVKGHGNDHQAASVNNASAKSNASAKESTKVEAKSSTEVTSSETKASSDSKASSGNEAPSNVKAKESSSNAGPSTQTSTSSSSNTQTGRSPNGNNGTLKVHGPGDTEDEPIRANEPHPGCTFHLHGFGFDASSSGRWHIEGQGGNAGSSTRDGTWAANASGEWKTAVIAGMASGHYKAEAWQTLPNDPNGGAKQKVFWVECGGQGTGEAEQARRALTTAIKNATNINLEISANIGTAQQLQLSAEGQLALQNAINARLLLETRLGEANLALNALINAINSGTAAEIAVAVGNAQTDTTNLNTAASGAASANLALGTQIAAAGPTAAAHAALLAAITNAHTVANQLAPLITAAQLLLPSLTQSQRAVLNTALQNAITANGVLGSRLGEAEIAMNALNTAISFNNAAQIAAAVTGANQAAMNLNAAAGESASANAQLGAQITAFGGAISTGVTPTTATGETAANISTSSVPSMAELQNFAMQAAARAAAERAEAAANANAQGGETASSGISNLGAQTQATAPQTSGMGVSPNVSNLPSTSTGSEGPLAALGAMLLAIGVFLLRKPISQLR